jgi:hypothetical protein
VPAAASLRVRAPNLVVSPLCTLLPYKMSALSYSINGDAKSRHDVEIPIGGDESPLPAAVSAGSCVADASMSNVALLRHRDKHHNRVDISGIIIAVRSRLTTSDIYRDPFYIHDK